MALLALADHSRWDSPLGRLALVAAATLVGLGVAELALRVLAPVPPLSEQVSYEIRQSTPGVKPQVRFERNEFGFRSLSMTTRAKPPRTLRVIALGASTTEQSLQNIEDTWTGQLEIALRPRLESLGFRVEVAAYGLGGWTVGDLLSWSRGNLWQYQPDLVVTLVGINDFAWKGGPGYTGREVPRPSSTADLFKLRCDAFLQLCRRLERARMGLDLVWRFGKAVTWDNLAKLRSRYQSLPYVDSPRRAPDPIYEFSAGMAELLGLITARGVDVVVLGQPVLWKETMTPDERAALWFSVATPQGPVRPSTRWLAREMARFNAIQRRQALNARASYVPLDSLLPSTLQFYVDDCHVTDLGSHRISELVAPVVWERLANGLNPRSRP